jgi:hypothetical protein
MSEATVNSGKLFARIAQVMGKVRSLPKDGYNKQNSYNYVSNDTALEAIGKHMAEFGVVVIPSMVHYETITDGKMTRAKAEFDMHVCGADGDVFTARWTAEGIDYGNPDKALTKAITYATKTFLIKLFVVGAGGEDPDAESAPDEKAAQRNATPQRPAPTPKPTHATNGAQHRQPAAQATKPVDADAAALAASVNATINNVTEFDAIPDAKASDALDKARKSFYATIATTFPKGDIDDARHWFVKKYTTAYTPNNVRESSEKLTADELTAMTEAMKARTKNYRDQWIATKTAPIANDKQPATA